ncbi:MAG: cupin domain-containing protein [Acidimicrobiia bacterium]|nr:cupin domain-containing protein [Acidimicrobiia bacterium]
MEHTPSHSIAWTPAPGDHFTGDVWFGPLAEPIVPGALNALGVLFSPSARTDWHTHPEGQVLYVASGAGRVGTDTEVVDIAAGDVVVSPPGERHWHGAAPGSYLMHLSLTTGGATEWETNKVTGDEYGAGR